MITHIFLVDSDVMYALDVKIQLGALYPGAVISHYQLAIDAMNALPVASPDVVLLDVVLEREQASYQLAKLASNYQIPVVFFTAIQRTALFDMAKSLNPANYLQKPVSTTNLKYALELAVHNGVQQTKKGSPTERSFLLLKTKEAFKEKVAIKDITHIVALGNYCVIHTLDKKYIHRMVLKNYQEVVGSDRFVQIARQVVINIDFLIQMDESTKEVLLQQGIRLKYGSLYKKKLLGLFER